jgi:hypothetical protein
LNIRKEVKRDQKESEDESEMDLGKSEREQRLIKMKLGAIRKVKGETTKETKRYNK